MAHWQTLAKPIDSEQKYLFCYFLSENARYLETAEKIAREKHLTIRMLPMVAADFKKPGTVKEPVGPREWLGLIENADYVLTDSFHCTLFSIRFHKQFNVLQRFKEGDKRGQNSRIHTLLQTANMQNRLVVARARMPQRKSSAAAVSKPRMRGWRHRQQIPGSGLNKRCSRVKARAIRRIDKNQDGM